ncbi:MAG: ASKHA domain-containing protein [Sedimentisphaerales bacterium]
MKHFSVTFKPDGSVVRVHAGCELVEAAGLAGIVLNTVCGQKGVCGRCAVTLEPQHQVVLACQYRVESDITVFVPRSSRFAEHKILTEGAARRGAITPDIYKKYIAAAGSRAILGLAIDIGTTTVVVKLADMKTGDVLATAAAINPQSYFGDDVISRIAYASTGEKLNELNKLVVHCINKLIADCCTGVKAGPGDIYETCIVGNTTMNHIFLRLPVSQLGQAPYKAFSLDAKDLSPGELGLNVNPKGNVHCVANIAGFVGADTTAVALAAELDKAGQISLAIDIGTNGEVVLGTRDKLFAASCAAGPAFEGARIACGSRAAEGAIEAAVLVNGELDLEVIGAGMPRSLCGSGLIDAVAVLLDMRVIDSTGRFTNHNAIGNVGGTPAFILSRDETSEPRVYLTQKDIREVQLAKAAIRTGIRLLEKRLSISDSDIKQIFLAGAFGNYIRPQSAVRIGMLPAVSIERIQSIGNAASSGAQLILLSHNCRNLAKDLAKKIQYIEIAHDPQFESVFTESIPF